MNTKVAGVSDGCVDMLKKFSYTRLLVRFKRRFANFVFLAFSFCPKLSKH